MSRPTESCWYTASCVWSSHKATLENMLVSNIKSVEIINMEGFFKVIFSKFLLYEIAHNHQQAFEFNVCNIFADVSVNSQSIVIYKTLQEPLSSDVTTTLNISLENIA